MTSAFSAVLRGSRNAARRGYEYAWDWARAHGMKAEDQLEAFLNTALIGGMDADNWKAPPEIEALYLPPKPLPPNDLDDDIPF